MSAIAPSRQFVVASSDEREALAELEAVLVEPTLATMSVVAVDGRQITLPASALREIVHDLARGFAVELAALPPEMTTGQAAAALHVPEPYLLKLLAEGVLPATTTDRGQFVRLEDVTAYE